MKRLIYIMLSVLTVISCSEIRFGDDFLGDSPESSGADIDTMFNSAVNAEKVLAKAYTYLPYGLPVNKGGSVPTSGLRANDKMGINIIESLTDLHHSYRNNASDGPTNLYYNGSLGSKIASSYEGTEAYRFGSEYEFYAVRYAWIFIENIHKVPDMTDGMKRQRVAEAKLIIAIAYYELLKYMGGVPIIDHAVQVNEVFRFPRATFEQTVEFIVRLIDEAKQPLPWKASYGDDGRMTRSGALGLKVRVLLHAASPTFNSNEKWHPQADRYTCYGNYDRERWKRVIDTAEEFLSEVGITMVMPEEDTFEARQKAFRKSYYERFNGEILISTRRGTSSATLLKSFFEEATSSGPTLNYVNMFPWSDGTDFPEDFNWASPERQPFFDAEGNPTRDPRLYETVAVPGSIWFDGTMAPLHINHPKYSSPCTGFFQMKFILNNASDRSTYAQWPYMRLSELYLAYAEALNEYNGMPGAKAYEYVNKVRSRVGLKPISGLTHEQFRDAVLKERACELGFEEVRWFDMVRHGLEKDFTKQLYELESIGNKQNNPTSFTFRKKEIARRAWADSWDSKWYLSPVPDKEINMDYGMTQNPGW